MKLKLIAASALALALTASAVYAQDERVLVVAHAESTDSLDPARGYTQTTGIIEQVTYETLVTFPVENAGEILPQLASDWTIAEDGLSYTFNLNTAATFWNGDPVTADDVVFSINRLKNIQGNPSFLAAGIESVTADDADTVTFTLAAVDPTFLTKLANPALSVLHAGLVRENGGSDAADAATSDMAESFLNGTSAGTGPYILEEWDPQVRTVLVRNEAYWGDAPYFDRIVIANVPDAATQYSLLQNGEADIALDLTANEIETASTNANLVVASTPGNIVHFLLMNRNPDIGGPMSNPLVQQAVRLSLDYPGYVELWGGITPATTMAFGLAGAFGSDRALTRDLDAARALLAEAGYPDGFDITLDYPIFTFQGVNMETNAQKIQADLAEVGINVTLNPAELQISLEGYRNGTQGFGYWFWGPDILDPNDQLAFLPGGKVATERAQWTEDMADSEILALRDQALVETDQDARLAVWAQIQEYMQQNGTFAAFLQPNVSTAFVAGLEGYVWHPQWLVDLAELSRAE